MHQPNVFSSIRSAFAARRIWKGALAGSYSSGHARPGMRWSEGIIKSLGMAENLIKLDLMFLARYLGG